MPPDGEWVSLDQAVAYRWDAAELRRMNRTDDERAALMVRLARQRIRHILRRVQAHACGLLVIAALTGCQGCLYGREYVQQSDGRHVCLDP